MAIDVDICCVRTPGICTHRTGVATAKDTVKDIAVVHPYSGVGLYISLAATAIYTTFDADTFFVFQGNGAVSS